MLQVEGGLDIGATVSGIVVGALMICLIYDFISNKKMIVSNQQVLTSILIAVILGSVFTFIFFNKTYVISRQEIDLEKLKSELSKNKFKLIKEEDVSLCFRGNISNSLLVGDIKIHILQEQIKIQNRI